MSEALRRAHQPAPEWDEALAAAGGEFHQAVERYRTLYNEIIKEQSNLQRLRGDAVYELLGLFDNETLKPPPSTQDAIDNLFGRQPRLSYDEGELFVPSFKTRGQCHAATEKMLEQVHSLQAKQAAITAVQHYRSMDPVAKSEEVHAGSPAAQCRDGAVGGLAGRSRPAGSCDEKEKQMKEYQPLRSWACPSYDPNTGKAASAFLPWGARTTIEGQEIAPNSQLARGQTAPGTPSLKELDQMRTQGGSVKNRPYG
jgi:hypothetical protein